MDLSTTATGAGIAACSLAIAFVLWKRKKAPKAVGWLGLVAGFGIGGGLLGDLLHQVGGLIGRAASTTTAVVFGVAVPAALLVAIGLWVGVDLWHRNKPSRALPYLALLFPVLLATVGGVFSGLGNEVLGTIGQSVQTFMNALVEAGG